METWNKKLSPIALEENISFDYTKIVLPENCELKKDGLILLSY